MAGTLALVTTTTFCAMSAICLQAHNMATSRILKYVPPFHADLMHAASRAGSVCLSSTGRWLS